MSKELSAKEFLKQISPNENYGLRSELQKHRWRRMVANTMEAYANARLEAYKAELMKWLEEETKKAREKGSHALFTPKELLDYLNNTPEYTEAEQNCRGCMGPCGYCEPKTTNNESK